MTVTNLPTRPEMSEAEWETRCDLAALYRILHHLRMTDLIYTHMTARVPGEDNTFLINHYGELFDEITASSLIKMDMDGNVIGEAGRYNDAGFTIHSGVYKARPDVNAVVHTHTRAGIAVSMSKRGLLPLTQDATVIHDDLAYHDYGPPASESECEALGKTCQQANCIILRNHGLLTLGNNIPAAFLKMYFLEHACVSQMDAASLNDELVEIDQAVLDEVTERYQRYRDAADFGQLEWQAMLRMLERNGADYRR